MRRTKEDIIRQLKSSGYVVSRFTLRTEGMYSVDDASWNYRDGIVHLSHVHPQVKNIPVVADSNKLASIFLQRVFGIQFPIGVFDFETAEHTQTTFFTFAFFVVVVENVCESHGTNRASVTTNYHICSAPLLRWAHPIFRWLLKRNYRLLMAQDVPLRERRGELRSWGFSFTGEEENRSYLTSLNTVEDHVVAPEPALEEPPVPPISLSELRDGERIFVGRDDHRGLQFVRDGDEVLVFQRLCLHQGASLDSASVCAGRLTCGWHGRKMEPLTRINLAKKNSRACLSGYLFELREGNLHISFAT